MPQTTVTKDPAEAVSDPVGGVVTLSNVTFTYGGATEPALADVTLSIAEGECVLVTGPAGAGKTTLASSLNGIVPQFYRGKMRGTVLVEGMSTKQVPIGQLAHRVGLVFQDPADQLVASSVEDDVAFGAENYGVPAEEIRHRVSEAIELVRLSGLAQRPPYALSGGQQQACALAAILAMRPNILVLDEPTSNLDPLGSKHILQIIADLVKRESRSLIVIEHKLEELLPLIDRIVVMDGGRIIRQGTPDQLFRGAVLHEMDAAGVHLPQVTRVAIGLEKAAGLSLTAPSGRAPVTVEEGEESVRSLFSRSGASGRARGGEGKRGVLAGSPAEAAAPIIDIRGLTHIYSGGNVALRDVDLRIRRNEFVAVIGQNGSGKTTLVKHFNGLLRPTRGEYLLDGRPTAKQKVSALSRRVGYCFQNPDHQMCNLTVREELEFGPRNMRVPAGQIKQRVDEAVESMGLAHVMEKNPFSLSKGERQKVAVAAILTMQPEVVVVDEPTTGQDFKMGREMMEIARQLHRQGKTVIVITHDMSIVAEYCERAVVMCAGQVLVDGPVRDVFSQPKLLETTSLEPPQVTRLAQRLGDLGFPPDVLSVEEMVRILAEALKGGVRA